MKPKRQRWYKIQFKSSLAEIIDTIIETPYNEDNTIGFELIETSKSHFTARYIEQYDNIEELHHPFGEVEEIKTVKYIIFNFDIIYLKKGISAVKIINPPVSLKGFVKKLTEICNNELYISRVYFDIEKLYEEIKINPSVNRYTVNKLKVSSIQFSEKTTAKLSLNSLDNAYEEFKKKYKNRQFKLEKMYLNARVKGESELIKLSSSGLIFCTAGFDDIIEKYIVDILKTDSDS
jgi:hypothetical protein